MSRIYIYIAAFASLLLASCQEKNDLHLDSLADQVTVTYNIRMSGTQTVKAEEEAAPIVTTLRWAAYSTTDQQPSSETDMTLAKLIDTGKLDLTGSEISAPVRFIRDQNFVVIFWAHNEAKSHYIIPEDGDLRTVRMNTSSDDEYTLSSNDSSRDAFYAVDYVVKAGTNPIDAVELVRPIAQINIGTHNESIMIGNNQLNLSQSEFIVTGLNTAFSPVSGSLSEPRDVTFIASDLLKDEDGNYYIFESSQREYIQVALNYVFAPVQTSESYDLSFIINIEDGYPIELDVPNVPVRANYRTNIIGDLLTSNTSYTITFTKEFSDVQVKPF